MEFGRGGSQFGRRVSATLMHLLMGDSAGKENPKASPNPLISCIRKVSKSLVCFSTALFGFWRMYSRMRPNISPWK
ncbi:MAG: hypothetical protein ACKVQB_10705 [Bacteroidia bacterium]